MEERFTYTVMPRRPIRNLIKGKVVSKTENLSLTKDEVLYCLKYGSVYRKFYGETKLERVVPSNLDRLHRKEHLSEKDYKSLTETGHYVASGFFDIEGSGATDPNYQKKHSEEEDQSMFLNNTEEESVSSEPENIGSDNETSDDNIVEEAPAVAIINTTSFPKYVLNLEGATEEIETTEEEVDVEELLEDDTECEEEEEEIEETEVPSNDTNQNNNPSKKKKKKRH